MSPSKRGTSRLGRILPSDRFPSTAGSRKDPGGAVSSKDEPDTAEHAVALQQSWHLGRAFLVWPIVALTVLLYGPWLTVSKFQPREDALRQAVPWFRFAQEQVFSGRLPAWDPARLAGTPHLGNIQAGFFYPPNLLLLPLPAEVAVGLSHLAHIALGGLFLCAFARSLMISREGSALAGMIYVASAFVAGRTFPEHVELLRTMAWSPLIMLCVRRLAVRPSGRWAAWLGAALAMSILAGYIGVTVYSLGAASVLLLLSLGEGERPWQSLALASLSIALATAIASPAVWPLLELASQSTRAGGLSLQQAAQWSLNPIDLPALVWPWIWGAEPFGGSFTGGPQYWHEIVTVGGVVVTGLACFGAVRRRGEPVVRILTILVAGSLILSLGTLTPAYTWLHELVPPLRSFRIPARFLLVHVLVLPILAGIGFDEWNRLRPSTTPREIKLFTRIGKLLLVLLLAEAVVAGHVLLSEGASERAATFAHLVVMGAISGVISILLGSLCVQALLYVTRSWAHCSARHRQFVAAFYGIALLELVVVAVPSIYAASDSLHSAQAAIGQPNIRSMQASADRVALGAPFKHFANFGDILRFRSVSAYDPLLLGRTTELLRATQTANDPWGVASNNIVLTQDGGAAFDVLGVRYFLTTAQGGPRLLSRPSPLPHVSLVATSQVVPDKQASLRAVLAPGFDPHNIVVLEAPAATLRAARPAQGADHVALLEDKPGLARVSVNTARGGYLVFSESYYPDWMAEEGSQRVPLTAADHAIMAVGLAPGTHDITFRFTTPWLLPSLALSLLGLSGVAALLLTGLGNWGTQGR